jgi:hypothetical protein
MLFPKQKEVLADLRLIARHLRKSPLGNLFIACPPPQRGACPHCSRLSPNHLSYDEPNSRYKSLFELFPLGEQPMPPEFATWQHCRRCSEFYFRQWTDLQRHQHLVHPGVSLTELCPKPFSCNFRLPRDQDVDSIPVGPYRFCAATFETAEGLSEHRDRANHSAPKKGTASAAAEGKDSNLVRDCF